MPTCRRDATWAGIEATDFRHPSYYAHWWMPSLGSWSEVVKFEEFTRFHLAGCIARSWPQLGKCVDYGPVDHIPAGCIFVKLASVDTPRPATFLARRLYVSISKSLNSGQPNGSSKVRSRAELM